jgi:hypothetical protein
MPPRRGLAEGQLAALRSFRRARRAAGRQASRVRSASTASISSATIVWGMRG